MESQPKLDAADPATTTIALGVERPAACENDGGCLVQIFGDGLGRRIELPTGELSFGRDDHNDVVLALAAVSRHHCTITCGSSLVVLRDLGSTNGTLIGDEQL